MKSPLSPKNTGKGLQALMAAAWLLLSLCTSAEARKTSGPLVPPAASTGWSVQSPEQGSRVAQRKRPAPDSDVGAYERLSPEERDRLKGRSRRWEDLPQEKRQELERRMERWQQMSPEQRDLMRKRHRQWQELRPDEQERIREQLNRWDRLTPQEQEEIRRKFKRP